MVKGTPEQLMRALEKRITELGGDVNACESIYSAREEIDDGEETILAEEEVETEDYDLEDETADFSESEEDVEEDVEEGPEDDNSEDSYLDHLYSSVEDRLNETVNSLNWSSDSENIYLDVNFSDGHVFTFTIPREDLGFDESNIDADVNYICVAVQGDSEDTAENTDTAEYSEASLDDAPTYL